MEPLDLAVIGGGAAGTWVARTTKRARPAWSVALFERHARVGGRLRSVHVPGLNHPIELGGMRYLSSHRRVQAIVAELGIETRPFDPLGRPERSFLRGVFGDGPTDPNACGESFSRGQAWVEGALETAETATDRMLAAG